MTLRTTPIRLTSHGKPLNGYHLGVEERQGGRTVWGLVFRGRMTNMSYGLDYADPAEAADTTKTHPFAFDVGNKLHASRKELEQAFVTLGLMTDPHVDAYLDDALVDGQVSFG